MLIIVIARWSLISTLLLMSSLLWYSGPRVVSIPFGIIFKYGPRLSLFYVAMRAAVNFECALEVRRIVPSLCTPLCPRMTPAWHEIRLLPLSLLYWIAKASVFQVVCLRILSILIAKLWWETKPGLREGQTLRIVFSSFVFVHCPSALDLIRKKS